MRPYKKVILTGAILTALAFTSSAIAQDAGVSATSTTPVQDARLEAKAAKKTRSGSSSSSRKKKHKNPPR